MKKVKSLSSKNLNTAKKNSLFISSAVISIILLSIFFFKELSFFDDTYNNVNGFQISHDPAIVQSDCVALSRNLSYQMSELDDKHLYYYASDLLESYKEHQSIENVFGFDLAEASYYNNSFELKTAYPETYDLIRTDQIEGQWFSGHESSGEYPEAVVCGMIFNDVSIGDTIEIESRGADPRERITELESPEDVEEFIQADQYDKPRGRMTVKVIGKLLLPYYSIDFRERFSDESAYARYTNSPCIYLLHNDVTVSAMKRSNFDLYPQNSFIYVTYKTGSEEEKETFKNYITSMGYRAYNLEYSNIVHTSSFIKSSSDNSQYYLLNSLIYPVNIGFLALSCIISAIFIIVTIQIYTNYSNYDNEAKNSAVSIIKSVIAVSVISAVIGGLLFLITYSSRYCMKSGFQPIIYFSELMKSTYFLNSIIFLLVYFIILCSFSCIATIIKFKSLKNSIEETKESYTYRQPEYYSEYNERSFEVSDPNEITDNNQLTSDNIRQNENYPQ